MKRKGYNDIKKQIEANERYLEKNVVAGVRADRSRLKSRCLKFIKDVSNLEELQELKKIINKKIEEVKNMEGFERLGTGWFALKDDGIEVFLIALKKDVNTYANTLRGCYVSSLKEGAKCLTEQELKKYFKEKTGKEYTTEELRKPSTYKKFLDELTILGFAYANDEFIRVESDIYQSF